MKVEAKASFIEPMLLRTERVPEGAKRQYECFLRMQRKEAQNEAPVGGLFVASPHKSRQTDQRSALGGRVSRCPLEGRNDAAVGHTA